MINKKAVNKFAAVLIGIAIVIAIVSFFYINRGTDIIIPRNSTNSSVPENIANNNIEISNFAFSPSTLTINKGDTVVWTNKDSATHTVTSDSGNELKSGNIETSNTYSHTFNDLGTFSYHCSIHTSMHGKIIVQ